MKMLEWARLAIKGLPNIDAIAMGVINDVRFQFKSLPEDEQDEIVRRRLICQECPLNSFKAKKSQEYFDLYGKYYETDRTDFACGICGCPISTRSASLESNCGLEEFNKSNPDKQQELKWKKYEK